MIYPLAALGPLNNRFREVVDRPEVEKEILLPLTTASWDLDGTSRLANFGGRVRRFFSMGLLSNYPSRRAHDLHFTLGKTDRSLSIPTVVGARLQERNPNEGKFGFRGRSVQLDLRRLVESVTEIRRHEGFEGAVISPETVKGRDPGLPHCRRVRFGLRLPADDRFKADVEAAKECHDRIMEATFESGFKLEPPSPPFDPKTGMKGLAEWADNVRLIRGRRIRPWWFLPLLLLFCLIPWSCQQIPTLLGMEVPTPSFELLVDRSSSMKDHKDKLRAQVERFLDEQLKKGGPMYGNIIFYDGHAESVLHGIKPLTPENVEILKNALAKMKCDIEETNLCEAMDVAEDEMRSHEKPTTVCVFSDGADDTIKDIIKDKSGCRSRAGVSFTVNTTTPRLLTPNSSPAPRDDDERNLSRLAQAFGGNFGPAGGGGASPGPNENSSPPSPSPVATPSQPPPSPSATPSRPLPRPKATNDTLRTGGSR